MASSLSRRIEVLCSRLLGAEGNEDAAVAVVTEIDSYTWEDDTEHDRQHQLDDNNDGGGDNNRDAAVIGEEVQLRRHHVDSLSRALLRLDSGTTTSGHRCCCALKTINLDFVLRRCVLSGGGSDFLATFLVDAIGSLPTLQSLSLNSNALGIVVVVTPEDEENDDENVQRRQPQCSVTALLGKMLRKNRGRLKQLYLRDNYIDDQGAKEIADGLRRSSSSSPAAGNGVGGGGSSSSDCDDSRQPQCLESLDLARNCIGDAGAVAIARTLDVVADDDKKKKSRPLLELGDDDDGVKRRGGLSHLWLCGNRIGNKGGLAFASALRRNVSLQTLYLTDNIKGKLLGSGSSGSSSGSAVEDASAFATTDLIKSLETTLRTCNSTLNKLKLVARRQSDDNDDDDNEMTL